MTDIVINSLIEPIYEGSPTEVRDFLESTREITSDLRVRAGRMQKIVSVEEYLKTRIASQTRRDRVKELIEEILDVDRALYFNSPDGELAEEYTQKMLKIITLPTSGLGFAKEDEKK